VPTAKPDTEIREFNTDIPLSLKGELVDRHGRGYRDFRRELQPRYGRIWRDIALGYAAMAAVVAALAAWDPGFPPAVAAAAAGALVLGYALAFLNNFFHEAAHYNLVPDRQRNDLVTNALMGWLFGSSIATYRQIHFQHHRALGTTEDSENSYFDPLRTRYLVEGLSGLKVLRTLRRYRQMEHRREPRRGTDEAGESRLVWSLVAAAANLAVAAALWLGAGAEAAAAAWLAGLLLAFPFFVSLRQLLEHRAEDADPALDYREVDHGAVNRLFGDGPVASTLGSAGFNRHALHHWEPNVSYTRLGDLEGYLLETEAAEHVRRRRTTYAETFVRLFELR